MADQQSLQKSGVASPASGASQAVQSTGNRKRIACRIHRGMSVNIVDMEDPGVHTFSFMVKDSGGVKVVGFSRVVLYEGE